MTQQYKRALRACNEKQLRMTKEGDLELFCYTKEQFFSKQGWDDLTKSHRGALYHNARQVNKPFKKIFNVGEVDDDSLEIVEHRMATEEYEVYHKANGHLLIISSFTDKHDEQQVVFHTKGSLPNEQNDLLNDDIKVFWEKHGAQMNELVQAFPNSTWMFEAIVSHDKHTLYEQEVERFGDENCFVLLGMNAYDASEQVWNEAQYNDLIALSNMIGCPLIDIITDLDGGPEQWLNHNNTEGYVIRFISDGHRVKVKTKEYWQNRFKRDLSCDNIMRMFNKAGEHRIILKLPEEVGQDIVNVIDQHFGQWFVDCHINRDQIEHYMVEYPLTQEGRADLFKDENLTEPQKQYIAAISDGKDPKAKLWDSKAMRKKFGAYLEESSEAIEALQADLDAIVDQM